MDIAIQVYKVIYSTPILEELAMNISYKDSIWRE